MTHITLLARLGAVLLLALPCAAQCEVTELLPTPLWPQTEMGCSVALDGNYAVAGAPANLFRPGGTAFVFEYGVDGWTQTQELAPTNPSAGDCFGNYVAISGDTMMVSAAVSSSGGTGECIAPPGTVHVYERSPSGWEETQIIDHPDPRADFGVDVKLEGDTALIGARGIETVYFYERTPTGWAMTQSLSVPGSGPFSGMNLDLNGDRALVGAATGAGGAYLFENGPMGWVQIAFLTDNTPGNTNTGREVALANGQAFLAAPFYDVGTENNAGAVFVYEEGPSGWERVQIITEPVPDSSSYARLLAAREDWLVVWGSFEAIFYRTTPAGWVETARMTPQDVLMGPSGLGGFPRRMAIDGGRVLIGAPRHSHQFSPESTGAAYLFSVGHSEIYCTSSPNSSGQAATLDHAGTPSIGTNDFGLVATGCPAGTFGIFAASFPTQELPFGNGTLCLAGELFRLMPAQTDARGSLEVDLDLTTTPFTLQPCVPVHFQFVFRDLAGGGLGFDTSNGLRVYFVN